MQGEEFGKIYRLSDMLTVNKSLFTLGRKDALIRNDIEILENQSTYISRKHCTIEHNRATNKWLIRDGQWEPSLPSRWKESLNGTYINSDSVPQRGMYINVGDIISIGDVKIRVENY
jgi:pSer/pThr/pTyr-binding forkhead associated (FHA) protein